MLTGRPNLPRDHRAGGNALLRNLLAATQVMEIRYVAIKATVLSDSIALNAAVLPMLIRDTTIVYMHVKMMAFTGTWKRRSTFRSLATV